jgi:hypothetical protein
MSDGIPPPQEDPNTPPVQNFAAYPRGGPHPVHGSPEKLQALMEGYYGLNWVFILNVALAISANVIAASAGGVGAYLGFLGFLFVVVALTSYPMNKKIAFGKDWAPGTALVASILMGLNSALFCGIIGFVVMQIIAAGEIKAYGVKSGAFGFKKKDVLAKIEELRSKPPTQPF